MTKNNSCPCPHCCVDNKEPYSVWSAQIHRDFNNQKRANLTHEIPSGTKVKMSTGETGTVKDKSRTLYHISIDQLNGEVRSFEARWVEVDDGRD